MSLEVNPVAVVPVEPINLASIENPKPGSIEFKASKKRDEAKSSLEAMPWLPQGADDWMTDIYERLEQAEREYVAPHLLTAEYADGTAIVENEIALVHGSGSFLFTAPHATKPIRAATGKLGFPDYGTAGLTAVLAEEFGNGLIMRGRQTGSAAIDPNHPLKTAVDPYLAEATGFIDVHACASHLFVRPSDDFNVFASIGLGEDPSEALTEFAHDVARSARRDLGLYVIVGNEQQYYSQQSAGIYRRNDDDTSYVGRLAGQKPNMMNNYVRRGFRDLGKVATALQVEVATLGCVTPMDGSSKKDRRTRVVMASLGYKLFESIVERAINNPPETL